MIVIDCEQGSDEWINARLGIPSASNYHRILTPTKLARSEQRKKYMYELCSERITGEPSSTYRSPAMMRGNDLESEARDAWREMNGDVVEVGFCLEQGRRYGASPDGISGRRGLEIKCPSLEVHHSYINDGVWPTKYKMQALGCLLVTGLDSWEFFSYFPGVKNFQSSMTADKNKSEINILREALEEFCDELDALYVELTGV